MKLIIGLGNPGKEYEKTRHNIGFMAIDNYVKINNISDEKNKFNGIYYEINTSKEKVYLLKPQKYMNLSGEVIRKFVDYFKIDINDILVISDDLDMECAKIKLKPFGSSGGHNGLKDIERNLNTQNYKRLKIGISKNKDHDTKDYVLGKFSPEELSKIEDSIKITSSIIDDFINLDFDKVMNKYN